MDKKKMIIIGSTFIGILVLLLIILWIVSLFSHKYYTYEEVEAKMVKATEDFYKSNPEILPVNDGRTTLPYNTLVENGFIKPLNELLKDGDTCNAEIGVIKNDNNYTYLPKLVCSDKYATIELTEQILKTHEVVSEGSGLYSDGQGGYYFKGKITDNYVIFGTNKDPYRNDKDDYLIWRILGIDKENRIKLVLDYPYQANTAFDNRYNESQKYNIGYNDFEMSVIKDYLKDLEKNEEFLNANEKGLLSKTKLCIAPRKEGDQSKDGSTECSILSKEEYLYGLISPYEVLRASLDDNCKTIKSFSCQNFNMLVKDQMGTSWTLTPVADNNYQVYIFNDNLFTPTGASNYSNLLLTVTLNPYATFKSGDGTKENPYILIK